MQFFPGRDASKIKSKYYNSQRVRLGGQQEKQNNALLAKDRQAIEHTLACLCYDCVNRGVYAQLLNSLAAPQIDWRLLPPH